MHGPVPGGSTGESLRGPSRSASCSPRSPSRLQTGGCQSSPAPEPCRPLRPYLAKHAAETGAAALMAVSFHDAPNLAEVNSLLKAAHDASGLSIVYYNIPSATGVSLTAKEAREPHQAGPGLAWADST